MWEVTLTGAPGISRAVLEITVGHRTLSDQILKMSGQFHIMIGHDDRNISPAHLELSSTRRCQSMFYVRPNLSNVRPKGRFERTYVLRIKKNYFQHCTCLLLAGILLLIWSEICRFSPDLIGSSLVWSNPVQSGFCQRPVSTEY